MDRDLEYLLKKCIMNTNAQTQHRKRFACFSADIVYCSFEPLKVAKSIIVDRASGNIVEVREDIPESGEAMDVIRLDGIVLPPFVDVHTHIIGYSADKGIDLRGIQTWEEVFELLKQSDPTHQHWLIARGWDESKMKEDTVPTKQTLNTIRNDIPIVLIRVDGHMAICNDRAIQEAGLLSYKGKDFDGNKGFVKEEALNLLHKKKPLVSLSQFLKNYIETEKHFLKYGVVASCEAGINHSLLPYVEKLKPILRHSVLLLAEQENYEHITQLPFSLNNGISLNGIKMFYDGSLGANTALLFDNYAGRTNYYGLRIKPIEYYTHWLSELRTKEDIIIATHAIGDRAVHEIATLYADIKPAGIKRIEHVQVVRNETISLMRNNEIVASIQPVHFLTDKNWLSNKLTIDTLQNSYRFKTLMQNVITIIGTDFPVEDVNTFINLYAGIFRKNPWEEESINAEESLNIVESMASYTRKAALWSMIDKLGTLEPNQEATFMVVNHDLVRNPDKLPATEVQAVFIKGEEVSLLNF